jgi:hypothetical protein
MNLNFIKAERTSLFNVDATYTLDDIEFVVEWSCIHAETGEFGYYDLGFTVRSLDTNLAERVSDAIKIGESDKNQDLELYIFIRDTFDQHDCTQLCFDNVMSEFELTGIQIFKQDGYTTFNYEINDCFLVRYDDKTKEFSIPTGNEQCWDNDFMQYMLYEANISLYIALKLDLPTNLEDAKRMGASEH